MTGAQKPSITSRPLNYPTITLQASSYRSNSSTAIFGPKLFFPASGREHLCLEVCRGPSSLRRGRTLALPHEHHALEALGRHLASAQKSMATLAFPDASRHAAAPRQASRAQPCQATVGRERDRQPGHASSEVDLRAQWGLLPGMHAQGCSPRAQSDPIGHAKGAGAAPCGGKTALEGSPQGQGTALCLPLRCLPFQTQGEAGLGGCLQRVELLEQRRRPRPILLFDLILIRLHFTG